MGMLDGKVALITGGASGFGEAGAKTFAREGAKVAIADLNETRGAAVVKAIKDAGGEALFIKANMSNMDDVRRMIDDTAKAFGGLDIFWHNAGNVGPGAIEITEEPDYDLTMAIHLKAGFFGSKHVLSYMQKRGGGNIIYTSSTAGLKTSRASPTYGIAKAGLIALTKNLAISYGPHKIRVNSIAPGAAETPLWGAFTNRGKSEAEYDTKKTAEVSAGYLVKTPLGRMTDPQDIANAALFLASDLAAHVTGEIMPVDGGLSVI